MSAEIGQPNPLFQDVEFGYLDRATIAPKHHNPHLVLNSETDSMLRAIRHELRRATSFTFSVAFVSSPAIQLLKQELVEFAGVGTIVTSNYLGFNSPQVFSELLNLNRLGIAVRLHPDIAFHPKGYVFTRPDSITAILGSSNLTEAAITRNHEWNLRVTAARHSDLADQFTNLLDEELFDSVPLTQGWIDQYAKTYRPPLRNTEHIVLKIESAAENPTEAIAPNTMQIEALAAIAHARADGKNRALIISATGTGKTILSALDVRAANPDRLLFVAHREQILDRAIHEFRRVLGGQKGDYGKLAGASRQGDRRYVFATVQTLSQESVLSGFDSHAFDYVLIDEVHRAGAQSFARVIAHFKPNFLLGMTATPERPDGTDIFELFDYNVPYEIRLKSALELKMLSPFHYYGVADITFDDGLTTTDTTPLTRLVSEKRVRHILDALETYGQAGVVTRGLIFCSSRKEAHALSIELNTCTLRNVRLQTIALTGDDSIEFRELAIERLEAGELDYILTVDIFNEGVDIPTINQIVMLRQTQSSIVFVQQLGRGLRIAPGKDYLVVIDFIGNYANNFFIPIALFGDQSLNKESLRKNLIAAEEVGIIAGLSSVRFDRIAHERVLRSLSESKLDSLPNLKAAIESVRNRVGRMPFLYDFLRFDSVDPLLLATKLGNYPALITKLFKEESGLQQAELKILTAVSKELLLAKRPHELLLLRELLSTTELDFDSIREVFSSVNVFADDPTIKSTIRSLTFDFNTATEKTHLDVSGLAAPTRQGGLRLDPTLAHAYAASSSFKSSLDDALQTGIEFISRQYRSDQRFTPGMQYSRKDASRLLNWTKNAYSTIYGYKIDKDTQTCPIFVTLHKSNQVSASTAYEDELLDPEKMVWYSRSKRTLRSPDENAIVSNRVSLQVFAKKDDAAGSLFYYLGQARSENAVQTTMDSGNQKVVSVVQMVLHFDKPVMQGLFDYFRINVN